MSATQTTQSTENLEPPMPLVFTDSAVAKVADLIAEEGNPDLKLRVFVPVSYTHLTLPTICSV